MSQETTPTKAPARPILVPFETSKKEYNHSNVDYGIACENWLFKVHCEVIFKRITPSAFARNCTEAEKSQCTVTAYEAIVIRVLLLFVYEPLQECYRTNAAKVVVCPLFHAQMMSAADDFQLPELYQVAYNEMMQFFPKVNKKMLHAEKGSYKPYEGTVDKEAKRRILRMVIDVCGDPLNEEISEQILTWLRRVEDEVFGSEVAKFRWLDEHEALARDMAMLFLSGA